MHRITSFEGMVGGFLIALSFLFVGISYIVAAPQQQSCSTDRFEYA